MKTKPRLKSFLARFLYRFLSKKAKRLVFLSSLYGFKTNKEMLCEEEKEILNNKLNLCNNIKSLDFPMFLNKKIWGNINKDELFDCLSENKLARKTVANMPCWLIYDNIFKIIKDVKDLFKCQDNMTIRS